MGITNEERIMKIKSTIPMLALLVSAGAMATGASAAGSGSTITIRHQTHGCHSWSANGDAYKATQAIKLHHGASLTVTNNDVMPHKLIETSGPSTKITRLSPGMGMGLKGTFPPAMLARMGSSSKVTFAKPGVYKFTTKVGEDYMSGVKTTGEDNVLKLTVTVS
jgi:plastocyanin